MKNKKTNMRQVIRQIVREEVAMAIQEVITELKQPTQSQPTKPIQEKKNFSTNSVLNDVLNETANGDWKTLGGGEFTTERMNELVGGQYGGMMEQPTQPTVNPNDPMSQFVNKDYREVLKKSQEKQKQKYGK